jgi:hypothetical protein
MKAGVEFFRAQRMWQAYQRRGLPDLAACGSWSVRQWFDAFIEVLARMPVMRVARYLDDRKTITPRTKLNAMAAEVPEADRDNSAWNYPADWEQTWRELGEVAVGYMSGESYAKIGGRLFGTDPSSYGPKRSDGARGIPPVFKFIGEVIERNLAVDAGCFLALHEGWLDAEYPELSSPEALQALPLCIRNGCSSLDQLAWFRFGFRQRVCAHALANSFPMPVSIADDIGRAQFVRTTRRVWLDGSDTPANPLLSAARTVIREGSSERS